MKITQKTLESIAHAANQIKERIEDACRVSKPSNSPLRKYSVKSLHEAHLAITPFLLLDSLPTTKTTIHAIRYAIRAYDNLDTLEREILPERIGEFVESARGMIK